MEIACPSDSNLAARQLIAEYGDKAVSQAALQMALASDDTEVARTWRDVLKAVLMLEAGGGGELLDRIDAPAAPPPGDVPVEDNTA